MAPPKKLQAEDNILSRRIYVNVTKDVTSKVPRVIWAHELPILELVFGEGNIVQIDPATLDEGYNPKSPIAMRPWNAKQDIVRPPSETLGIGFVFAGEAEAEYARLAGVYGRHIDVNQPNVETVYGRFQAGAFQKILGIAEYGDMPDGQLRQIAIDHGHVPPLGQNPEPSERKEVAAIAAALMIMPREKLLALVEELAGALV